MRLALLSTQAAPSDAVSRLAARVVRAAGNVPVPSRRRGSSLQAFTNTTLPGLLTTIFAATDLATAARLGAAPLQRLLSERIQEDYQRGALVHIEGWWLAHTEAAILQLGSLLAARGAQR